MADSGLGTSSDTEEVATKIKVKLGSRVLFNHTDMTYRTNSIIESKLQKALDRLFLEAETEKIIIDPMSFSLVVYREKNDKVVFSLSSTGERE